MIGSDTILQINAKEPPSRLTGDQTILRLQRGFFYVLDIRYLIALVGQRQRLRIIDCKVNDFFETLAILGEDSDRCGQDFGSACLGFLNAVWGAWFCCYWLIAGRGFIGS